MPTVPVYEGGSVQDQGTTSARLQAADYGPGIGPGIAALGRATGEFVDKMDTIQQLHDEANAKQLDIEHLKYVEAQKTQLANFRGEDAQPAVDKAAKDLAEYDQELLGRARSPRARVALENSIAPRSAVHTEQMEDYGRGQFVQHMQAVNIARRDALTDNLIGETPGTPGFDLAQKALSEHISSALSFNGEHDPRLLDQQMRGSMDKVYGTQAQTIYGAHGAEAARSFVEQHAPEMFADTSTKLMAAYAPEATKEIGRGDFLSWVGKHSGATAEPQAPADGPPAKPSPRSARTETMDDPSEDSRVSSGFGHRTAPTAGASTNHKGWDIPMPVGSEVDATLSGRVEFAGQKKGFGNTVIIDHGNGLKTQYSHLSSIGVGVGDAVDQGDAVAKSGNTGVSTGPHLHYQVWDHGAPADPAGYVGKDRNVAAGGTTAAPPPAAKGVSLESALQIADDKQQTHEWSPQYADAWRQAAREHFNRVEAVRSQSEDDANRAAATALLKVGPENFTSLSQLPADVLANLSPTTRLQYAEHAQAQKDANQRKAAEIKVDPDTEYRIAYTRAVAPDVYVTKGFFNSMVGKLPASGLRELARDQGTMAGELANPKPQHTTDGDLLSVAKDPFYAAGIDLDPSKAKAAPGSDGAKRAYEQSNQVLSAMKAERDAWEAKHPGEKADEMVKRKWVSNIMFNLAGTQHQNWNATPDEIVGQMTDVNKRYVIANLRMRGLAPTNENIVEVYRRLRAYRDLGHGR